MFHAADSMSDVFDTFDAILLVRPETWWDIDPLRIDGRVLPMFLEED